MSLLKILTLFMQTFAIINACSKTYSAEMLLLHLHISVRNALFHFSADIRSLGEGEVQHDIKHR